MARDRLLIGVGHLQIGDVFIDNPTTFEVSIENEEFELRNASTVGGGNYAKKTRIDSITWSATIHNYRGDALAKVFRGDASTSAAASIVDEDQIINANGLTPTDELIDIAQTVVVTENSGAHAVSTAFAQYAFITDTGRLYEAIVGGTTDAIAPTFPTDGTTVVDGTVTWQDRGVFSAVAGTDFVASAGGINDQGTQSLTSGMPHRVPVQIDYESLGVDVVDIATSASISVPITFDGFDEESNQPLVVSLFQNDVAADGGVPFSTEEYGEISLAGEAVLDNTQPAGQSQYGRIRLGQEVVV